jgi:hypothetical protein
VGAVHGALIVSERLSGLSALPDDRAAGIRRAATLLLVMVGWVMFRADVGMLSVALPRDLVVGRVLQAGWSGRPLRLRRRGRDRAVGGDLGRSRLLQPFLYFQF